MTRDDDLGPLLMHAARGLRHAWAAALEPWGLTPHQFRALLVVRRAEGPRLGIVADELRVAARSATEVVDALESLGLVRREADPADRRATCVQLTERGEAVLDEAHAAQRRASSAYFAPLGDDVGRFRELLGTLGPRDD